MSAEHERRACDLPAGELQRAFDKESTTSNVAAHVTSCEPCSGSLNVLQTQRDAVRYLTTEQTAAARRTAVEFVLSQSATAGRQKLADLLYELAKSFLVIAPAVRLRVVQETPARAHSVIAAELGRMSARLPAVGEPEGSGLTASTVPPFELARRCLTTLRGIERESERFTLMLSNVLFYEGNPAEAERSLRALEARGVSTANDIHLRRNTSFALLQQLRYDDAVSYGKKYLSQYPNDELLLYNTAVSMAWAKDRAGFEDLAGRIGAQQRGGAQSSLAEMIDRQAAVLADQVDLTPSRVRELFGLL